MRPAPGRWGWQMTSRRPFTRELEPGPSSAVAPTRSGFHAMWFVRIQAMVFGSGAESRGRPPRLRDWTAEQATARPAWHRKVTPPELAG